MLREDEKSITHLLRDVTLNQIRGDLCNATPISGSKELTPFAFEGSKVRVLKDADGKPWFVAKDVCEVLGYANPRKAVADHCKGVTKRDILTLGGLQTTSIIPESDLYRLILRSNMPDAERFQDWVTEVVLPSIRETGGYVLGEENMNEDELTLKVMQMLKNKVDRYRQQILLCLRSIVTSIGYVYFLNQCTSVTTSVLTGHS